MNDGMREGFTVRRMALLCRQVARHRCRPAAVHNTGVARTPSACIYTVISTNRTPRRARIISIWRQLRSCCCCRYAQLEDAAVLFHMSVILTGVFCTTVGVEWHAVWDRYIVVRSVANYATYEVFKT